MAAPRKRTDRTIGVHESLSTREAIDWLAQRGYDVPRSTFTRRMHETDAFFKLDRKNRISIVKMEELVKEKPSWLTKRARPHVDEGWYTPVMAERKYGPDAGFFRELMDNGTLPSKPIAKDGKRRQFPGEVFEQMLREEKMRQRVERARRFAGITEPLSLETGEKPAEEKVHPEAEEEEVETKEKPPEISHEEIERELGHSLLVVLELNRAYDNGEDLYEAVRKTMKPPDS